MIANEPDHENRGRDFARSWPAPGNRPVVVAFVAILALQLALTFSHRPWFDEWQALQIALQSPSLSALLDNLRYEGHPPLWYLLLRWLALVVPAEFVLPVAAALVAVPTQWLIVRHAPFPLWQRIALSLGVFVLFEYFVVSRSLTLGVATMFFAVALRRSRWLWLALAILPQCDFLFGIVSLIFIALAVRDRTIWLPGFALWASSSLIAAWSVIPAPDMMPAIPLRDVALANALFVNRVGLLLVPLQAWGGALEWNSLLPMRLGYIAGPVFFVFAWLQLAEARLERIALFLFVAITYGITLALYPLAVRHLGLIAILLICMKWRQGIDHANPLFGAWLLVGAGCGLAVAALNLQVPFNTSHLALAEIRARGLMDKQWTTFPENRGQAISGLSGLEFRRIDQLCTSSFVRWDRRPVITTREHLQAMLENYAKRGRSYLLTDIPLDDFPATLVRPLAVVKQGYDGYAYHLFVLAPESRNEAPRLAPCAPARVPLSRRTLLERRLG